MSAPGYCPRCGAPLQAHFRACPQCGAPVTAHPQAQGGYVQPQPQPAPPGVWAPGQPGPYPGQAPPPYSPGTIPQAPYGVPPGPQPYGMVPGAMSPMAGMPQPPPATSSKTSKGTALLGGCGAAGCLGAVVTVMIAAAVIVLAVAAADSSPTTPGPTPPAADTGAPAIAANLPNHGPLRNLIRSQVGAYSLVTTASVTKYPELLTSGMVDSLGAIYLAPDRTQVNEMILAYTSAQVARHHMDTVLATFQATYGPSSGIVMEPVRNQNGVVIGARVAVVEPGGLQHVYWSNSNVLFIVTSTAPHAGKFHEASPY